MHQMTTLSYLKSTLETVSRMSGLYFSVYDSSSGLLLSAGEPDTVTSLLLQTERGAQEVDLFTRHAFRTAMSRHELVFLKDPAGQHHFFFPLHIHGMPVVVGACGFFGSEGEFNDFLQSARERFDISKDILPRKVPIKNFPSIKALARDVEQILNGIVSVKFDCERTEKYLNYVKTVLGILTNASSELKEEELQKIMMDFPLLLMDLQTVSYASYSEIFKSFTIEKAAGKIAEQLKGKTFAAPGIVERVLKPGKYLCMKDIFEISSLGFGELVSSVYMFPVRYRKELIGVFSIYDSEVSDDECGILELLLKGMGALMGISRNDEKYEEHSRHIISIQDAAKVLDPTSDEEELFQSIVHRAGDLVKANRASLMLLESDDFLHMKAVRGINSHIAQGIRIRVGEPVAGMVAETRSPLIVRDASQEMALTAKAGTTYKTKSFICIPLVLRNRTIGVLNVTDKITGTIFSEQDFNALKSFASYASVVIESSNYFRLSEEMREISITDSLTGIYNRRHFDSRFLDEIQRSERHNFPFSFGIADIDDFKSFNDNEGHLVGDSVLKTVANIIRESLRSIDILARFGGEEFSFVFPQTEKHSAYLTAERVRENVKNYCPKIWKNYPKDFITLSIGLSSFPDDGADYRGIVLSADKALYMAKMQGKDRTIVYRE